MNKALKIFLIIFACLLIIGIIGGIIAFIVVGNESNAEEYKIGDDIIKSIKAVMEKREVVSTSTEISDGITTKKIAYKSNTVQEDLMTYVDYLRNDGGFNLTKDMDLSEIPSIVELGKESKDDGKLIMMTIEYDSFGYTIVIQKGEGTLTLY